MLAAMLAGLTAAAPARADEGFSLRFFGPGSGGYTNYQVNFSGGTATEMWVSETYNFSFGFYWRSGESTGQVIWGDTSWQHFCIVGGSCDSNIFRRIRMTPESLRFSMYTMPSFNRCDDSKAVWNDGSTCANVYEYGESFVEGTATDGTQLTLVELGGGAIPEPASWALLVAGFALTGGALRAQRGRWARG